MEIFGEQGKPASDHTNLTVEQHHKTKGENIMPEHSSSSSTTAKTALGFGIAGTAGVILDFAKDHLGKKKDEHHERGGAVNWREMELIRESSRDGDKIAKMEAERYADHAINKAVERLEGKIAKVDDAVDFINEKFTRGHHELAAKYGELHSLVGFESERRKCGDEKLHTYVDSNFIRADKVLDKKHINYGIAPCTNFNTCSCGCDHGEKPRGGKAALLADLISDGAITGTLTLGAATSA